VSSYYYGPYANPGVIAVNRTGRYVRVQLAGSQYLVMGEVQVWGGSTGQVNWIVSDHLGTPRMIADQSGSLANMKRHDYLPFGEEIGLIGGRTGLKGFMNDGTRQKFTGYERDWETGLDYAKARYDASAQGRFLSVDPLLSSADVASPQSFNRYSYVENNPLNFIDPTGMMLWDIGVYQTSNPEAADKISSAANVLWRRSIAPPAMHEVGHSATGPAKSVHEAGVQGKGQVPPPPSGPNGRLIAGAERESLKSQILAAVALQPCKDNLTQLLEEAKRQTGQSYRELEDTFDRVALFQGETGPYEGYAGGSIERGDAYGVIDKFDEPFISIDRSEFIRRQTVHNALGEVLHHVGLNGAYRDGEMANAMNAIMVRRGV
jgi:RHS repeat-associated protein